MWEACAEQVQHNIQSKHASCTWCVYPECSWGHACMPAHIVPSRVMRYLVLTACIKLSILCTTHVFAVQSNTYAGPVCMCDPGSSSAQVLNPIIFAVMVQAKVEPTHTTSHTSSHEYLTSIVPDVCQPKLNHHIEKYLMTISGDKRSINCA